MFTGQTSSIKNHMPTLYLEFSAAWWRHQYGLDFSQAFWQDPIARVERTMLQERLLYQRYGDLGLGSADPRPRPLCGDQYAHRFMSALWGCEIHFDPGHAPAAIPLPEPHTRMQNLAVPDLDTAPVMQQTLADAELLWNTYGACESGINYGGPLNNAVSVFGAEIIYACAAEPELAQQVLYRMAEAIVLVHDYVNLHVERKAPGANRAAGYGLGNCPVSMLSPALYQRVVLPVDVWLRKQFSGPFNLHHCGRFHPYIDAYRALQPDSLDVGPGTDLHLTRAAYPITPMSAWIEVGALQGGNEGIERLVNEMVEAAGPPELLLALEVADAGPEDLTDEVVRALVEAVRGIG